MSYVRYVFITFTIEPDPSDFTVNLADLLSECKMPMTDYHKSKQKENHHRTDHFLLLLLLP